MSVNFFQKQKLSNTERPLALTGEFLARYDYVSQKSSGKSILDIGCGLGEGSKYLAEAGAKRVLGIDYAEAAVDFAREKNKLQNLEFRKLSAENLDVLKENFDIIVAFELIEHLGPKAIPGFMADVSKKLAGGGTIYISTPNKLVSSPNQGRPENPFHEKEYAPDELEKILRNYFQEVELLGLNCISDQYKKTADELKKNWQNKLASAIGRYKLARNILSFLPKSLKQSFTGENQLPKLGIDDFVFSGENIQTAENLFAICRMLRL
ncbi:MAG: methyltransferase domain-containing protein [Candidatus Moranbacteria bacterium]|nr:methyltransferase domain-containing protein [Candidatus Moranbacteria bacterium]